MSYLGHLVWLSFDQLPTYAWQSTTLWRWVWLQYHLMAQVQPLFFALHLSQQPWLPCVVFFQPDINYQPNSARTRLLWPQSPLLSNAPPASNEFECRPCSHGPWILRVPLREGSRLVSVTRSSVSRGSHGNQFINLKWFRELISTLFDNWRPSWPPYIWRAGHRTSHKVKSYI